MVSARHQIHIGFVIEFLIHVLVGTAIFVLIASAAVALDIFTKSISGAASQHIILVLQVGEYCLLACDISLFLTFLAKTTWRAAKNF